MTEPHVRVFVTVGTDHHPFERLIGWIDDWERPTGVDVLVQHGSTRAPLAAEGVAFLDVAELRQTLELSDLIVTQGGPGGIMDARRTGRRPIVVPRRAALGEAVDDHQVAFARHLARLGTIDLVENRAELHRALSAGVLDPDSWRCTPLEDTAATVAEAVGREVGAAVARRRRDNGLGTRLPSLRIPRS